MRLQPVFGDKRLLNEKCVKKGRGKTKLHKYILYLGNDRFFLPNKYLETTFN